MCRPGRRTSLSGRAGAAPISDRLIPSIPKHILVLMTLLTAACGVESKPAPRQVVIWRSLGSWTGSGSAQTESFASDTGALRVHWEAKNETAPGKGTFRATVHSAISGRALVVAVEHHGIGRDTSYVTEDPRSFYVVVDATNLDWSITVEEGIMGTVVAPTKH